MLFLLCFLLFSSVVQAEFLICKKDNQYSAIDFMNMEQNEKNELVELYKKTILRYEFPSVMKLGESFTEKQAYMNSLQRKRGLFEFIKGKVEQVSSNKYSIVWVPRTLFELTALLIHVATVSKGDDNYCPNINNDFRTNVNKALGRDVIRELVYNPLDEGNEESSVAICQLYLFTSDILLQESSFKKEVVDNIDDIMRYIISFIKNPLTQEEPPVIADGRDVEKIRELYGDNWTGDSLYNAAFDPVVKRFLSLEVEAFNNNQFTFVRGTDGYKEYIDHVQLGRTFSYGYSLFAGSLYRRPNARAIDQMFLKKIGYALLIPIADVILDPNFFSDDFNINDVVYLPILSALQGLFGAYRAFHPWFKFEGRADRLNAAQLKTLVERWFNYFLNVHIIKFARDGVSMDILMEDKELQLQQFMHQVVQKKYQISLEEQEDFEKIIKQMKESSKSIMSGKNSRSVSDQRRDLVAALRLADLLPKGQKGQRVLSNQGLQSQKSDLTSALRLAYSLN